MSLDRDDPAAVGGHALGAISWPAIFAGAATALATAFMLDVLGAGFGLSLSSPWLETPNALAAFSPLAGAWAIAAEVAALALGGYVAGRLRTHWWGVHADETHFRDTAHGLLVWAVSAIAGVALTALVLVPYASAINAATAMAAIQQNPSGAADALLAAHLAAPTALATAAGAQRAAHIAAQASLFSAIGLFLGAFVAAAAAALGGLQRDEAVLRRAG